MSNLVDNLYKNKKICELITTAEDAMDVHFTLETIVREALKVGIEPNVKPQEVTKVSDVLRGMKEITGLSLIECKVILDDLKRKVV